MKRIKINTDLLYTEARGFKRSSERLAKIGQEAYDVFHSIDLEYSGSKQLNQLMIQAIQTGRALASDLDTLMNYLNKVTSNMEDCNRTTADYLVNVEKIQINFDLFEPIREFLPIVTLPWIGGIIRKPIGNPTIGKPTRPIMPEVERMPEVMPPEGIMPGWPNDPAYQAGENPFAKSGYGGQCTSFVWGRVKEKLDINLPFLRSAKYWWEDKAKLGYTNFGTTPRANAIAIWAGDSANPHGHVGFVESVNADNTITFNEANVKTFNGTNYGGGYDGKPITMNVTNFESRGKGVGKLLGYIYLD